MADKNGKRRFHFSDWNIFGKQSKFRTSTWVKVSSWFILISTIPLLLLALLTFQHTKDTMYAQVNKYTTELLKEVSSNVSRELYSMQNISLDIAYMSELHDLCVRYYDLTSGEVNKRRDDIRMNISYKLSLNRDITDVFLYTLDGDRLILYGDKGYQFNLLAEYEEELLAEVYDRDGHVVLHPYSSEQQSPGIRRQQDEKAGHANCILIARSIRALNSDDILGILVMRVNERFFFNWLNRIDMGEDAEIIIFDARNAIISSTNHMLFPINTTLDPLIRQTVTSGSSDVKKLDYGGRRHIAIETDVEGINWKVFCLVPSDVLDSTSWIIIQNLIILLFFIGILIAIGIRVFKNILAYPLINLADSMKVAEGGDFDLVVCNNSPDEIGRATRSFNKVLEKIRELLDDVKRREKQKRQAELAALQAQINPHFLSNTLNMARCMAQTQQVRNIENILTALVDLLHISMDIRKTMITFEEEIIYLNSYVEIVRHRNYSTFDMQYDLQPDLADSLIPKLILQPIVENALTHGVNGNNPQGQVIVRVTGDSHDIHVTVTDNGQGMKQEQIAEIFNRKCNDNQNSFSGIGLRNVNERIKLLFGEAYGIHVESIYHMYTTIEIVIPNLKGDGCF